MESPVAMPARTRTNFELHFVDSPWFGRRAFRSQACTAAQPALEAQLALPRSRRPRFCFQCCVCSPASCGSDLARRCLNSVWRAELEEALGAPNETRFDGSRWHGERDTVQGERERVRCSSHRTLPTVCLEVRTSASNGQ